MISHFYKLFYIILQLFIFHYRSLMTLCHALTTLLNFYLTSKGVKRLTSTVAEIMACGLFCAVGFLYAMKNGATELLPCLC